MDEVELLKAMSNAELVARLGTRTDLTALERLLLSRLEGQLPRFSGRTLTPRYK